MANEELKKRESAVPAGVERPEGTPTFIPTVDIHEGEREVVVIADMPGVDEGSVDIDLERSVLTIRGRFVQRAPEGCTLAHREYRTGNYERAFTLGDVIDRQGVKATVRNGVLRLILPKIKEVQPHKIQVNAG